MRVEFDAGILVAEWRLRIGIHEHAAFAFPDTAMARGLGVGGNRHGREAEQAGVEAVRRVRIFRQRHVAPGLLQPRHIGLAGGDRIVIVGRAVKDPDRPRRDLGIAGVARRAIRIERNVGRELRAGFIPCLVEAIEAGIKGGLSAARKSHQHDALRVDPRMFCQDIERTVDIENQIQATEQRLVRPDRSQPAAGKTVNDERRNPHLVEAVHPGLGGGADAARSVHQHHDGQASRTLRDAEFTGDGDGLSVGVSGQELLVGDGERGDGVDLDPCRDLLRHRLGAGFARRPQKAGAENPGRHDGTHVL